MDKTFRFSRELPTQVPRVPGVVAVYLIPLPCKQLSGRFIGGSVIMFRTLVLGHFFFVSLRSRVDQVFRGRSCYPRVALILGFLWIFATWESVHTVRSYSRGGGKPPELHNISFGLTMDLGPPPGFIPRNMCTSVGYIGKHLDCRGLDLKVTIRFGVKGSPPEKVPPQGVKVSFLTVFCDFISDSLSFPGAESCAPRGQKRCWCTYVCHPCVGASVGGEPGDAKFCNFFFPNFGRV